MSNTFFQKKTLGSAILGLTIGLIFMIYPIFSYAIAPQSGIFNDDFESYNLGALNGQGDWVEEGTHFQVVNTLKYEGLKSAYNEARNGVSDIITKYALTGVSEGIISFQVWTSNTIAGTPNQMIFFLKSTTTADVGGIRFLYNAETFTYDLQYQNSDFDWITYKSGVEVGMFHAVQIQFSFPYWQYRIKIDVEDWSSYLALYTSQQNLIQGLKIGTYGLQTWIDDIGGELGCGLIGCGGCDNSTDCVNSGCVYEYLPTYERYECHKPYIAYVSGCGMGYGCYGCQSQGTCESALPVGTCEWVDRGYGSNCYPVEAPPPEATWEAPELESCEGLGTVETWLCEIRNFFAGLFMPTQEKVDNLKKTIDNFKAKFPFNYISALNAFFDGVKTSLDTEKDIPIKILGTESNVSFAFWDQSTGIGGTSETFKNILIDFTSVIIFLGFFIWLVSFIKRFF